MGGSRVRTSVRSALLIMLVASLALSMIGTAAFAQPAAGDDGSGSQDPGVMQDEEYEVLFFHLTTGFRHDSIEYAIEQVEEIGTENGFSVDETQDPEVFNDEDLAAYETVVFFTDGEDTLNPAQRTAFERYMQRGGGFVGLHSTSNMDNQGWPWWEDLMAGAFFVNHPDIQDGLLEIEDDEHPST